MARFYGKIGYAETAETSPGIYQESFTEKDYTGDIIRNTQSWERGEHLNDNVVIANRFSIIADDFATQNLQKMRYVVWKGVRWRISTIEDQRPRLILTVGEVFNGKPF